MTPHQHGHFPSPFCCHRSPEPRTTVELSFISLSNAIRNKPNWQTKVHNPEIVSKWRSEYHLAFPNRLPHVPCYHCGNDLTDPTIYVCPEEDHTYTYHLCKKCYEESYEEDSEVFTRENPTRKPMQFRNQQGEGRASYDLCEPCHADIGEVHEGGQHKFERTEHPWADQWEGLTAEVFDYAVAHARHDSSEDPHRFGINAIRVADGIVSPDLASNLRKEVLPLESVPDKKKDWHPGSNNQVLDLVHPSMYCFVEGETPTITWDEAEGRYWVQFVGGGRVGALSMNDSAQDSQTPWRSQQFQSSEYQWLPAEFHVDAAGHTTIKSYINNLHPRQHRSLYQTIAAIFDRFVPLFENLLTNLLHPRPLILEEEEWYPDPDFVKDLPSKWDKDDDPRYHRWRDIRQPVLPKIPTYAPPPAPPEIENPTNQTPLTHQPPQPSTPPNPSLHSRNLQVIVKLASIHLTPSNPTYPGGVWHIEGMQNESIVATGIYYYSVDNITESTLSFRTAVDEPGYENGDWHGCMAMYGLQHESLLNQELGHVIATKGRCIAFPNIYQHRVAPFSLLDPDQPGHRKILAFFLVDPTKRVISTKVVPPQQPGWMVEELMFGSKPPLGPLPELVVEKVVEELGTMGLERAKEHREELMEKRKGVVRRVGEEVFEVEFSLCEH
ncbi:hypothetical protein HDV00_007704 [Rhizophlyctis rosea]|nr:hypothetical protein HDV00_007704 [Rhizophlyctis rosea]